MFASENGLKGDPRLKAISEAIRVVPHFPKPGSSFCFLFLILEFLIFGWVLFLIICQCWVFGDFDQTWLCGICLCVFAGIMFQDITTLLLDHKAFKHTVDIFVDRYRDMDISVVAGTVLSLIYILYI